ncbi:helix-turn-helix domain-containing protein [Crenobacter cavernae]|uniref:Transcriptional regulator n=1 Tax=Crenobacter cavernae TaxID=2290923 RepID=A0ABY0F9V4_9NEIS|nr:helix-turn-helix domain-containing protein [Crenobacter cavernae]RXZ42446.1 transcriptional regulator [Crenobacter cavernae]
MKQAGLSYADVARALRLSEASVKRLFSSQRFTLQRLEQVAALAGLDLAELVRLAGAERAPLSRLSPEQESALVAGVPRLLVAVCVLNHWAPAEIRRVYRIDEAECLGHLLALERLGLIELLPGDRVRRRLARDFAWLTDGPIERFFREHAEDDFLDDRFAAAGETRRFLHGMLTVAARQRLAARLAKLSAEFSALHEESAAAPFAEREGVALMIAARGWEPPAFAALRRTG